MKKILLRVRDSGLEKLGARFQFDPTEDKKERPSLRRGRYERQGLQFLETYFMSVFFSSFFSSFFSFLAFFLPAFFSAFSSFLVSFLSAPDVSCANDTDDNDKVRATANNSVSSFFIFLSSLRFRDVVYLNSGRTAAVDVLAGLSR